MAGRLLALAAERPLDVVVIGGDAGAAEIAMALQQRLGPDTRVALVTGGGSPVPELAPAAQQRVARALARQRITVVQEACTGIEPGRVVTANGARLACDAPVVAGGLQPPGWLAGSGLALDAPGAIATGPTLQSMSHPGSVLRRQRGGAGAEPAPLHRRR